MYSLIAGLRGSSHTMQFVYLLVCCAFLSISLEHTTMSSIYFSTILVVSLKESSSLTAILPDFLLSLPCPTRINQQFLPICIWNWEFQINGIHTACGLCHRLLSSRLTFCGINKYSYLFLLPIDQPLYQYILPVHLSIHQLLDIWIFLPLGYYE